MYLLVRKMNEREKKLGLMICQGETKVSKRECF